MLFLFNNVALYFIVFFLVVTFYRRLYVININCTTYFYPNLINNIRLILCLLVILVFFRKLFRLFIFKNTIFVSFFYYTSIFLHLLFIYAFIIITLYFLVREYTTNFSWL